jgi:hypothetical protein
MAAQDFSALNKVAFGDAPPTLVPNLAKIQHDIPFAEGNKLGDFFEQPVRLALPGGFTRAKGDGTAGAFTLAGAVAGAQKKAKVYGYQLVLQDQLPYEDLSKAATAGPQAYKSATAFFWEGMQLSMRKMLEAMCLYGNVGIGKVQTYTSGDPSIVIAESDWAPQLWSGLEGATLSVMNGTSGTERGEASIVSVDIENRKITLSTTVSGCAANDIVYFKDGYGNEMVGLYSMLSTSGTLFNISNSTYSLWKATSHTVSGAFSFQALKKGLAKGMNRGLMYPINVYASTGAVDDLIGDIHQLRNIDKTEVRKIELGADEVVYKFAGITATVKAHPMVKNGHAFGIVPQFAKRVGSVDVGFGMPGRSDGKVWFDLEGTAAVEGRMYTHQAIFSEQMGCNILWSSITNSST